MNNKIYYVSACAGSGKTTSAIKAIRNGVKRGLRFVIAQPTIELCHATAERLEEKGVETRLINSDTHTGEVKSEFIRAMLRARDKVLVITHNLLLASSEIGGKSNWILIVDEVLPVDQSFLKNVSLTYGEIIQHLDLTDNPRNDSVLDVQAKSSSRSLLRKWAGNAPQDDNIAVLQPFWEMVVNPHIATCINRTEHARSRSTTITQLIAHGALKATVLDGWERVTIMAANFEKSALYMTWFAQGVEFESDPFIHVAEPAHSAKTGSRATVRYICERDWSKTFRGEIGGIARISEALSPYVGNHYIWAANNDVPDSDWKATGGERIPVMAQGFNHFRHHTEAVFLAALNDNPAHYKWIKSQFAIEPIELSMAKSMETAYQMIMRTNLREPDATKPVTITVADRRTADYLCSLLPGAKLKFLDLGIPELGEPRRDQGQQKPVLTNAERQEAMRERNRLWSQAHDALCAMTQSVMGAASPSTIKPIVSFETNTFAKAVLPECFESFDELKDLLRQAWATKIERKEDNLLMSGSTYCANEHSETSKGLDAFLYAQMIQLDFDDSELEPKLLSELLGDIKHVAYNSFSHVNRSGSYRYRVVVPFAAPVTKELYKGIWDVLANRIADAGFSILGEGKPGQMKSGIDRSKRTPVSWMYMPAQAGKKGNSFWLENWDAPLLDPAKFIGRIAPEVPAYVTGPVVDNANEKLRKLRLAMANGGHGVIDVDELARKQRRKDAAIAKALEAWRKIPAGGGNVGFLKFAASLRRAGCDDGEIRALLLGHYAESGSKARDRLKQIPSILKSLGRRDSSRQAVAGQHRLS